MRVSLTPVIVTGDEQCVFPGVQVFWPNSVPTWYGAWGTPASSPQGFQPNQTASVITGWATISQINVNNNAAAACPSACDTDTPQAGPPKPNQKEDDRAICNDRSDNARRCAEFLRLSTSLSELRSRAEHMMRELGDVKIGDPESQVLAILQRYGNYRKAPEDLAKFDKVDYEYEAEIGPSGLYYFIDRGSTGMFCRMTRAVLSSLNPRLRRAIGLRRWSVDGRVRIKENSVTIVRGMVLVEGSHEWLAGEWTLAQTIPPYGIYRFVTSPGVSWPHDVNHYLVGWNRASECTRRNDLS
jgi:hypothetical protein